MMHSGRKIGRINVPPGRPPSERGRGDSPFRQGEMGRLYGREHAEPNLLRRELLQSSPMHLERDALYCLQNDRRCNHHKVLQI